MNTHRASRSCRRSKRRRGSFRGFAIAVSHSAPCAANALSHGGAAATSRLRSACGKRHWSVECADGLTNPRSAGGAPLVGRREPISVVLSANIVRRPPGKRVGSQKAENAGVALQQRRQQAEEPV